jgi:hypothetical protein
MIDKMENKKPDNIVYSVEKGYNANVLPYATTVGAPVIRVDDLVSWKSRGITTVNKELELKFNELKLQYQKLMEEYEWNELVYSAKFFIYTETLQGSIFFL